ncbi:YjcZ family sporulation protein [Bacillus toyonensis]|nr:YjcZ family sporulation protein [Bacillus toyonensis]PFY11566.1 sporulation protein YjcZ [Bacillus toyonensis]
MGFGGSCGEFALLVILFILLIIVGAACQILINLRK